MPTPRSAWIPVDLGLGMDNADIANGDVVVVARPACHAGTIREVWVVADALPTAGTVAFAKGSTNILSDTNVNLASLTADTAAAQTLSTNAQALRVAETDMLKATWTFTTIGSGDGFGAIVWVEPDEL